MLKTIKENLKEILKVIKKCRKGKIIRTSEKYKSMQNKISGWLTETEIVVIILKLLIDLSKNHSSHQVENWCYHNYQPAHLFCDIS